MRFSLRVFCVASLSLYLFMLGCTEWGSRLSIANASGELQDSQKFTLNNLKDEPVNLDALLKQNKAVLINFWATWCPPCREEIPGLIDLQKKFKDRSFTVLGVDTGESKAKVSSFVEKIGINYPVVLDSDMAVTERYSVHGIPTSFLVASEGKILGEYHAYSRQLEADVEKALEEGGIRKTFKADAERAVDYTGGNSSDPFFYEETEKNSDRIENSGAQGPMVLQGIVWDVQSPKAIVSGKVVAVGSKIGDTEVIEINRTGVRMRTSGREFTLKMGSNSKGAE